MLQQHEGQYTAELTVQREYLLGKLVGHCLVESFSNVKGVKEPSRACLAQGIHLKNNY